MEWKKVVFKGLIRGHRMMQRVLGASTVGVRILVVNPDKQILLVEHTYIDGWHLPGGGVNHMEPLHLAAKRELYEETGIIAESIEFYEVFVHNILGVTDYPLLYVVKDFKQDKMVKPSLEIKHCQWFAMDSLPEGTTQSTLNRLNEYFQKHPSPDHW